MQPCAAPTRSRTRTSEPVSRRAPVHSGAVRYAITGGTGFVGGRLARRLAADGHDVVALVREPGRAGALADRGARLVAGDVTDPVSVRAAAAGADGLFHVAGWYRLGARRPGEARRTNVEGTRTVLAAAQAAGVPRVVYTSTLAVNSDTGGRIVDETYRFRGRHLSVYDATKAEAHARAEAAAESGTPVVTVMPGLVYGPGDTSQTGLLLRRLLRGRPVVVPAGGRFCWGYVDDIAEGHLRAMQRGRIGAAYILAGPPHSIAEALRLAARLAGVRGPVVLPTAVVRAAAVAIGALEPVVRVPGTYSGEALRSSLATYLGDPAKAGGELGWSARSLEEGMAQTVRAESVRRRPRSEPR
jgi:nucleoside-diphosphate-sugar epimerase